MRLWKSQTGLSNWTTTKHFNIGSVKLHSLLGNLGIWTYYRPPSQGAVLCQKTKGVLSSFWFFFLIFIVYNHYNILLIWLSTLNSKITYVPYVFHRVLILNFSWYIHLILRMYALQKNLQPVLVCAKYYICVPQGRNTTRVRPKRLQHIKILVEFWINCPRSLLASVLSGFSQTELNLSVWFSETP